MSDNKILIGIVFAFGLLAAGWWFGWFGPMTSAFQGIKKNVVTPRR
jgi:hypothetical protein